MKVIVHAEIMSAIAFSMINNYGPTESVMVEEMIMVQRQRRISFENPPKLPVIPLKLR